MDNAPRGGRPRRHATRPPASLLLLVAVAGSAGAAEPDAGLRAIVSRADLHYDAPAPRSEEGMPLGNGRMGSLVWTSPTALRFQVNRVDIQPIDSTTTSFLERNSDYCCGAGFLDVDLGTSGAEVLAPPAYAQHLAVYDGLLSVAGRGVGARLLAWHAQDVIAIEVEDRRPRPEPVHVTLRMLRFPSPSFGQDRERLVASRAVAVRTLEHLALSQLHVLEDAIALTQEFREHEHLAASALVARVVGRRALPRIPNESEVRLVVPAAAGRFVILIGSAASLGRAGEPLQEASAAVEAAAGRGFERLLADNRRWWHGYWARGHVDLHSADGQADYVAANYHYFLYLMAASSRGKLPPKFNGMIWNTAGDLRTWGAQHWFANLSCYYEALPAANRLELMDPVFDMYQAAFDAYALAARQQWGSAGIFIPEVTWFDGLAPLPDDVAAEMRELYLLRKPWQERSARFQEYALGRHPHSSRWNWNGSGRWVEGRWTISDRGAGPYGPVTHILGTTAKVPYLYWRRYEFTRDADWLRRRAYPMLKGAAEFYRNFPNLRRESDGRYHIHHVNSNESVYGARDTDEDLSALRGLLAAAIRAASILGEDAELRGAWRELLENLAPLPLSDHPDAIRPADYRGPRVFVRGLRPVVRGRGLRPDANSLPQWFFDLCTLESADRERLAIANATFDAYFPNGVGPQTPVGVLSKLAIAAATLGRAEAVRFLVPNQMRTLTREREGAYRSGGVLANRLSLREGHQALDAQRLGRASEALHLALLQSNSPAPAEEPVLRLFPAWPRDWEASFRLLARGGFVVEASLRKGRIGSVRLESQAGETCRIRNPWGEARVGVLRDGRPAESVEGSLLVLPTRAGEVVSLLAPE